MLLLFMTSNKNRGLLDKPCQNNNIGIQHITGEFELKKFVAQDMSNLNCFSHIAIDLSCLTDTDDGIINTVVGLKSMYDIRIIIVAIGYTNDTPILGRLFAEGIYNIITADKIKELHEEMTLCLNSGMEYKDAVKFRINTETNTKQPKVIVQKQKLKQIVSVGVCGALHRTGTTSQALCITNFLNQNGYSACYIEENDHGHVETLGEFYDIKKKKNGLIIYRDTDIYIEPDIKEVLKGGYDFLVYDLGMFEEADTKQYLLKDIKIICAGSKPWEAACLNEVFKKIDGCDDVHFIFNFTPKETENDICNLMGKYGDQSYFSDYSPDIFDSISNQKIYRQIFEEYIHEEKQQTNTFQSLVRRLVN